MSVYVDYLFPQKLLFDKSVNLLRKKNPLMYAKISQSTVLIRAFAELSLKLIRYHAIQELSDDVIDEHSALKRYTTLLQTLFESITTTFGGIMTESCSKVDSFKVIHDDVAICPICMETECDSQLPCCDNVTHVKCFVEYRVSGFKQCPLCRREL